ncbi:MAG: ParB/RepB/Spo0J family partition protein [Beijerinckiaceae bacterium]|nr:MAG: ParB/RepB/Spo0J family partition protein [Beijerinckiaceae bacterium]
MAEETRSRLGRGLAALIGDAGDESAAVSRARQKKVPIEFLRPNPRNPRKSFDDAELDDLTRSIQEKGIIQPILARTVPAVADLYEIIAGERRWRAAQKAGLHEVPIIAIEADDKQALELAIIENVQRADLNALEEAQGYQQLEQDYGYTQQELAKIIGKSRSHVANTLRLLKLPERARLLLAQGALSAGHARALLTIANADAIADKIVAQGLSVRDVEKLAQQSAAQPTGKSAVVVEKDADTRALEKSLADSLGLSVSIAHRGDGGELRVRYKSLEQLEGLCRKLKV